MSTYRESRSSGCYGKSSKLIKTVKIGTAFIFLFCHISQPKIESDKSICNFLTRHSSVVWDAFLWVPSPHQTTAKMWSSFPANFPVSKRFWEKDFSKKEFFSKRILNRQIDLLKDFKFPLVHSFHKPQSATCPHPSCVLTQCVAVHVYNVCVRKGGKKRGETVCACVCSFRVCKRLKLDAPVI